ncbi:uncharacterized protein KZ484_017658 [Pholidichthys leucotaenia]
MVLQCLMENQLYVKAEKCEFHTHTTTFLGYIISQGCIEPDPIKVKAVTGWPVPTSGKELQLFLGFVNFYCRFIRNYISIAQPITALTSTKVLFCWSEQASEAFSSLKILFYKMHILVLPDPSRQFIVKVDASDMGWGPCCRNTR